LKPENVMVGEYGEVQVMDWGLAKVLPMKKRKTFARDEGGRMKLEKGGKQELQVSGLSPQPSPGIDSVRGDEVGDVLKTMDGSIMGTPGFMSPEQALGKTDEIDERTDIYALGAILYNILTLDVPVTGKSVDEVIEKVTRGDIKKPTEYNDKRIQKSGSRSQNEKEDKSRITSHISLPHLPDNRVPESLSAVAMKALYCDLWKRYRSVKELQKEVEAYQNGFATTAEHAGAIRQVQLFLKRHRTVTALTVVVALVVLVGSAISTRQWFRAEESRAMAIAERNRAREALSELKDTAPALMTHAKALIEQQNLDKALDTISYAIELAPESAEYRCLRANILQASVKIGEAAKAYKEVLNLDPSNQLAKENQELCRNILAKHKGKRTLPISVFNELYPAMLSQQRFDEAVAMMRRFHVGMMISEEFYRALLTSRGITFNKLTIDEEGLCTVDLAETSITNLTVLKGMPVKSLNIHNNPVSDLSPLKGLPLVSLDAGKCSGVTDLSPLKGMVLTWLDIGMTQVIDLSSLRDMPLKGLNVGNTKVSDLSPLKGMPLKSLSISTDKVTDLSPLEGMPLTYLNMGYNYQMTDLNPLKGAPLTTLHAGYTKVADLSPLKGMPLTTLSVSHTDVTDLAPLKGMLLTELNIEGSKVMDLSPLRGMKSLMRMIGEDILLKPAMDAVVAKDWVAAERECNKVVADWKDTDVPAMTNLLQIVAMYVKEGVPALKATHEKPVWVPSRATLSGGHHYFAWNMVTRWENARKICEYIGGHLVTINSEEEKIFAFRLMAEVKMGSCHLGFNADKGGKPQWITGEPWLVKEKVRIGSDPAIFGLILCGNDNEWVMSCDSYRPFLIEWDR
jgi:tetratricopeptide (TPR) repeat protein